MECGLGFFYVCVCCHVQVKDHMQESNWLRKQLIAGETTKQRLELELAEARRVIESSPEKDDEVSWRT